MRIGLDLHGVIDRFPQELSLLTRRWVMKFGHEVHIVTGSSWDSVSGQIKSFGIVHTHSFSIVDHHQSIKTPMRKKESGWWMDEETWNQSKGIYADKVGLDIHFEDTMAYAPYFPSSCTFVHVGEKFDKILPVLGDFLHAHDLVQTK